MKNKETDSRSENTFESLMNESVEAKFSWPKTLSVVFLLTLSIFLGFFLFSSYQKSMIISVDQIQSDIDESNITKNIEIKDTKAFSKPEITPDESSNELASKQNAIETKELVTSTDKLPVSSQSQVSQDNQLQKNTKKSDYFRVVAKTFSDYAEAKSYLEVLSRKGQNPYIHVRKEEQGKQYFVQLAAFKDLDRAEIHKKELEQKGFETFILE